MADDILKEAQDAFKECCDAEREDRDDGLDDIKFARLGEQWDEGLRAERQREGRPCLTINKLPPFIRQVVNDARQNKPAIKVQPQDSKADPETAEVMSGLIRNIEASSDADVAYDTSIESAATNGFGYFRINLAYACDDNWDQDLVFERVGNPFTIYRDPYSTAADSSDWNVAFATEMMSKKAFKKRFPGAGEVDFEADMFPQGWCENGDVMVAEYWTREQVKRSIVLLSNGEVVDLKFVEENQERLWTEGVTVEGAAREVMSYKVTQRILNGVEELDKTEWAGKYIPIVPVYGDEVNVNGKRRFRSLIRDAKDAQVMFNAWRTVSTELVALAPKAPWVGEEGAFDADPEKWENANKVNYSFIEHTKGTAPPQRQPFAGVPAGALQEALNASDDMKAIIGVYDASLGARSNETSGRAIMARQREGDVSTFHFTDNLARAIRHGGRILIDLIPKVYNTERMVRILGAEGEVKTIPLKQPTPYEVRGPNGEKQVTEKVFDLGVGKYDLTVSTGPSFTTRREETAAQLTELLRAYPQAAQIIGDLYIKNMDIVGGDEIADRLRKMLPPQLQEGGQQQLPPEVMQGIAHLKQAHQEAVGQAGQLAQENQQLKMDAAGKAADLQVKMRELDLKEQELAIKAAEAAARRMDAAVKLQQPTKAPKSPDLVET